MWSFPDMLSVTRGVAFIFILAASFYFGYAGRPAEMTLAIVAGAIALAFSYIDKIQKFKGAGFEAEMREKIDTIVAKETEPPKKREVGGMQLKAFGTNEEARAVIKALGSEKYTWRYLGGIAEDTGLSKEKIDNVLAWLVANDLATEIHGQYGPLWGLSSEGRKLLADIRTAGETRVS